MRSAATIASVRRTPTTGARAELTEWKENMAKQSKGDPPATSKVKEDRLKELEKLGTRGMLLSVLVVLGDERVSDDQLRRAIIILEGLEAEENPDA